MGPRTLRHIYIDIYIYTDVRIYHLIHLYILSLRGGSGCSNWGFDPHNCHASGETRWRLTNLLTLAPVKCLGPWIISTGGKRHGLDLISCGHGRHVLGHPALSESTVTQSDRPRRLARGRPPGVRMLKLHVQVGSDAVQYAQKWGGVSKERLINSIGSKRDQKQINCLVGS